MYYETKKKGLSNYKNELLQNLLALLLIYGERERERE
jgi:hypothetical protein